MKKTKPKQTELRTCRTPAKKTDLPKTDGRLSEKGRLLTERLKELYPESVCALEYEGDPWRLLVMARLSAQCTDARVNEVCRELFEAFPDCAAMAAGDIAEIERIIRPCGLFRGKADSIKRSSQIIMNEYRGRIPDSMEDLLTLPGVGRKIANLILGDVYGKGGIVADTHCMRICARFGFYPEGKKDPIFTEKTMEKYIDRAEQSAFCHRIVNFGRDRCTAQSPKCAGCPAADLCDRYSREKSR